MSFGRIVNALWLFDRHDLFGKPLHSFPDHALALNHAIARAAERIILGRS